MAWSSARHGRALLVRVCCIAAVLVATSATVQVSSPTTTTMSSAGYQYSMRGRAARRFSRAVISPSSPASMCQASGCSSSAERACCNGICVDVSKSVQSCGACNNTCAFNRECCSGVCVDTQASDHQNCGSCGRVCADGVPCLLGMCGYSR